MDLTITRTSRRAAAVAALTRCWPFFSGCGTLSNSNIIQTLAGFPEQIVWARVYGGAVAAPLTDLVGRSAYYAGDLDPKVSWVIDRVIEPGDTVLDIGANLGLMTVRMAKLAGPCGIVHAFEPNPHMTSLLRNSIIFNKFQNNVVIHDRALGDEKSTAKLFVPSGNFGRAFVDTRSNSESSIIIDVQPLDDVVYSSNIKSINVMKIDVEGFESKVLQGSVKSILKFQPKAILLEEHNAIVGNNWCESFLILHKLNYDIYAIKRSFIRMNLTRIQQIRDELQSRKWTHDFVAIKAGPLGRSVRQKLKLRTKN